MKKIFQYIPTVEDTDENTGLQTIKWGISSFSLQAFSLVLSSCPSRSQSKGSVIPIKAVTPYNTVLMGSRCCDRSQWILCHLLENYSSCFAGSDQVFWLSILGPICSFVSLFLKNGFLLNSGQLPVPRISKPTGPTMQNLIRY